MAGKMSLYNQEYILTLTQNYTTGIIHWYTVGINIINGYLSYSFTLSLLSEEKSSSKKISAKSITDATKSLGSNFIISEPSLSPEDHVCHNCKSLANLVKENEYAIKGEAIASIPMTISYLKLVDRVRSAGPGASKQDLLKLLKSYKKKKEVISSLLDILAGNQALIELI